MKSREALKIIEESLEDGKSKYDIFNELSSKVKFRSYLVDWLAMVPEHESRNKYKAMNRVLLSVILLVILVGFLKLFKMFQHLSGAMFLGIIFLSSTTLLWCIITYGILRFRATAYTLSIFLAIGLLILSIPEILITLSSRNGIVAVAGLLTSALPLCLVIFIAYRMRQKIFPYYNFWGQIQEEKMSLPCNQGKRG